MEIMYTLVIHLPGDHKLSYVDKDIKKIEKEIYDFEDKFGSENFRSAFSIEVKTEETLENGKEHRQRRRRELKTARKPAESAPRSRGKWSPGIIEFVRKIAQNLSRQEAVDEIKKKFGVVMKIDQYAALLRRNKIKGCGRGATGHSRNRTEDKEKELPKLPPEDEF